jgi:para-aminobenzoate synthetase component 1
MHRTSYFFKPKNVANFKLQLLQWAQQFQEAVWLDSNNYLQKHSNFDAVLAVDSNSSLKSSYTHAFEQLKKYQTAVNDYIFGFLSYDLKNDTEDLTSQNFDGLNFPDLYFFQPKKIIIIKGDAVEFKYLTSNDILTDIAIIQSIKLHTKVPSSKITIKLRIHKDEYFKKVQTILQHIYRGDIYEANFCQEFYSENATINPLAIYKNLNKISQPPFATFFKLKDLYLLSASPERYLKKNGETVISQPIKGTEKRAFSKKDDYQLIQQLENNPKERAENIMIVDLVRNDLSKWAIKGTVKVDELCKVYTFKQVHQLISTISCKVSKETHPVDLIKATFPMGSMTGAPKISAMKIIEEIESTKRGVYSGAVGYFEPNGNFDFNVIIRSILYNASKKYVSYSVGSAITSKSEPEKEYEECLLKAKAMKQVLLNTY